MAELAALGVASSILQIVDFGVKVIATTHKLTKAPGNALTDDIKLERLAEEQSNIAERLKLSLQSRAVLSSNEKAVVQISTGCSSTTTELLSLLHEIKVRPGSHGFRRIAGSAKAAFKSHRKRELIEECRRQLHLQNTQLVTALVLVLRYVWLVDLIYVLHDNC